MLCQLVCEAGEELHGGLAHVGKFAEETVYEGFHGTAVIGIAVDEHIAALEVVVVNTGSAEGGDHRFFRTVGQRIEKGTQLRPGVERKVNGTAAFLAAGVDDEICFFLPLGQSVGEKTRGHLHVHPSFFKGLHQVGNVIGNKVFIGANGNNGNVFHFFRVKGFDCEPRSGRFSTDRTARGRTQRFPQE